MSGDVQPRKRKDKRRKKDDEDHHHSGPDEIIHIQKDHTLGGNVCAKIVFFCLLGALGVMVGLIITEYRGSNEVDTQSAVDSPWSLWLEGWIDDGPSHHETEVDTGEIQDDHDDEHDDDHDPHKDHVSEEVKEDVAKISEILRRTSKKVNMHIPDGEDEEEKDEPEIAKTTKVIDAEEIEVEKSTVEQEEEEEEEDDDETSGGEQEQNVTEEGEIIPEISRRQTLVPPTEELPPSTPPEEEFDYSEGEEEGDEEEEVDEEELVQKTYEDLKTKYLQQTPEGSDNEPTEEDFAAKGSEMYDYSPTPPDSEGEDGPTESDIEDEEEEDDPMAEWKNRGSDLLAEEVEEPQTGSESEDEPPPLAPAVPLRRGGPRGTGEQEYINADITNPADWEIREDLDLADEDLNNGKPDLALTKFTSLLARFPQSPRALYGKAKAIDLLAEAKRSNHLLNEAIDTYKKTLELSDVPDRLFHLVANRTVDRMRFRGRHLDAVSVHNKLISRYHNVSSHRTELAITYLMINRLEDAKIVLKECLGKWPQDGLVLAYYGLVLKLQGSHNESITYLQRGIESGAAGTTNSHFYFHLGDALARKGQNDLAMHFYESGATKGLFKSKYQRSLYNVDHLKAQPWWSIEETTYTDFFRKLESNWKAIRDEGMAALKTQKGFQDEAESLRDTGNWKQFEIFARGQKHRANCERTPITCRIIDEFKPASGCRRGQSKFSVMEGGTHVWSHCGPTNCRLRAHLGLVVPNGTTIRVADSVRNWSEGKVLVFDDSFEHEVWHNGTENRLVLIVDVWHPELTGQERSSLSSI